MIKAMVLWMINLVSGLKIIIASRHFQMGKNATTTRRGDLRVRQFRFVVVG